MQIVAAFRTQNLMEAFIFELNCLPQTLNI